MKKTCVTFEKDSLGKPKPCAYYKLGKFCGSLCENHFPWETSKKASINNIPEHCRLKQRIGHEK